MPTRERISIGERIKIVARGKKGILQADFSFDGQHCQHSLRTKNMKIAKKEP